MMAMSDSVTISLPIQPKLLCYSILFLVFPWALESWASYNIKVYGDPDSTKYRNIEHAFCVINHRGDLDWMIGWVLIERIGMLGVSNV